MAKEREVPVGAVRRIAAVPGHEPIEASVAKRITMAQIASAAEVSVPTVSKVLNGRADVAPQTRMRVEALLDRYGYARTRRGKARTNGLIDLVFTEFSPWAAEIIRGASEAAVASGHRVVVSAITNYEDESSWVDNLASSRSVGVVLMLTELSPEHRARLVEMDIPIVVVDPVGQPDPGIPSIGAANWAGGLKATEHLLDLGHRRIGTITGSPSVLCSQARLDGYRAAVERAGIPIDPQLIAIGDFHYESALTAATAMVQLPDPPTAIFAASDVQAMGVYEAARVNGLSIPDDLSVVGFDDLPMAQWVAPPLTTLRQPLAEMAGMATRTLLTGDRSFGERVELSTTLVVRSSTAPPRSRSRSGAHVAAPSPDTRSAAGHGPPGWQRNGRR